MTYDTENQLRKAQSCARDTISHAVRSGEAKESERVVDGFDNVAALLRERGFLRRNVSLDEATETMYDALYNDVAASAVSASA